MDDKGTVFEYKDDSFCPTNIFDLGDLLNKTTNYMHDRGHYLFNSHMSGFCGNNWFALSATTKNNNGVTFSVMRERVDKSIEVSVVQRDNSDFLKHCLDFFRADTDAKPGDIAYVRKLAYLKYDLQDEMSGKYYEVVEVDSSNMIGLGYDDGGKVKQVVKFHPSCLAIEPIKKGDIVLVRNCIEGIWGLERCEGTYNGKRRGVSTTWEYMIPYEPNKHLLGNDSCVPRSSVQGTDMQGMPSAGQMPG